MGYYFTYAKLILVYFHLFNALGTIDKLTSNGQQQQRPFGKQKQARFVYLADSVVPRQILQSNSTPYKPLPLDKNAYAPPLLRRRFNSKDEHNFLLEVYLRECSVDRISFIDFKRAADHNHTALVKHFLAPGVTFMLPTDSKQPIHWLVQDLLSILDRYNASTANFQFVHLSDESLDYNNPNLLNFYRLWKKVYRHNWWNTTEYSDLYRLGRLDWMPLTQLRSLFLLPHELLPSSQRTYNISFRGNTNTNFRRVGHVQEVSSAVGFPITGDLFKSGSHSRDPTKITTHLPLPPKRQRPLPTAASDRRTHLFRQRASIPSAVQTEVKSGYLEELCKSIFCLNIKGRMPECHRLYEALDCGCIPVFIDQYESINYASVFEGWKGKLQEVSWRRGHELPFIWADNVTHFSHIYDSYMGTGGRGLRQLNKLQKLNMEWWSEAKLHIKQHFQNIFCSFH